MRPLFTLCSSSEEVRKSLDSFHKKPASCLLQDLPLQECVIRFSHAGHAPGSRLQVELTVFSFWLFTDLQLTGVRPCLRPESSSALGEFTHIEGWVFKIDGALSKPYTWVKLQSLLRNAVLKITKSRNSPTSDYSLFTIINTPRWVHRYTYYYV